MTQMRANNLIADCIEEYQEAEYIDCIKSIGEKQITGENKEYFAFEIKGDSMNDGSKKSIPDKAIAICSKFDKQQLAYKMELNKHPYWIIVLEDSILCKEIIEHNIEKGTIKCHSLNTSPEHQDFEIRLNDIKSLFKVIKKQF